MFSCIAEDTSTGLSSGGITGILLTLTLILALMAAGSILLVVSNHRKKKLFPAQRGSYDETMKHSC